MAGDATTVAARRVARGERAAERLTTGVERPTTRSLEPGLVGPPCRDDDAASEREHARQQHDRHEEHGPRQRTEPGEHAGDHGRRHERQGEDRATPRGRAPGVRTGGGCRPEGAAGLGVVLRLDAHVPRLLTTSDPPRLVRAHREQRDTSRDDRALRRERDLGHPSPDDREHAQAP
ncbi:hypothetical protein GCM10025864_25320 [Luteimicrobium album]|uniref:Uncharacterized protein n=1 Tax=Luteimicrobium album TaxID=1054550 RepID=A0ABQ6I486_9MICO|nr:hypothetical protein [Luteimicrobium album]GMA24773.1 hypothetical protein GCM10025864_25320 [Luteimicrobium album]